MSDDYIRAALAVGGELEQVRDAALLGYGTPQPHKATPPSSFGIPPAPRETNSCPCPDCYDLRLRTWETS